LHFVLHDRPSRPLLPLPQSVLWPRLIRAKSCAKNCRFLPIGAVTCAETRRPVAALPVSDPEPGRYRYHEGTSLDI